MESMITYYTKDVGFCVLLRLTFMYAIINNCGVPSAIQKMLGPIHD